VIDTSRSLVNYSMHASMQRRKTTSRSRVDTDESKPYRDERAAATFSGHDPACFRDRAGSGGARATTRSRTRYCAQTSARHSERQQKTRATDLVVNGYARLEQR